MIIWIWFGYLVGICLLAFLFAALTSDRPTLDQQEQRRRTEEEHDDEEFIALPTWWW